MWKVEPLGEQPAGPVRRVSLRISAAARVLPSCPRRAGTLPSSPPVRLPSDGNGNSLHGSFLSFRSPSRTPKTRNRVGGKFLHGPCPPPPVSDSGSLPLSLRCSRAASLLLGGRPAEVAASSGALGREMGQGEWAGLGKAPRRPVRASHPARRAGGGAASARPARGWAWERLPRSPPSSPGLRDQLQARGPGEGRVGEEAAGKNRRATVSFWKESRSPGWEKRISPPNFSPRKVFPGRFVCADSAGEPGDALPAWRWCPWASLLAPLLLLPAWAAPLPPREAPNGYPVSPTGRGLQRRLPPPQLRAAARTWGRGARGLGASARRWKRTRRRTGPGLGGLGRALDARPASLRPRVVARLALTSRPLPF